MYRRSFLESLLVLPPMWDTILKKITDYPAHNNAEHIVFDEFFWANVRQAFPISPNIINLNNAGLSSVPQIIIEALERYQRISNEIPTYYMKRVLEQNKEPLRYNIAKFLGSNAEEIAIQRNTTESLNNIIWGLPLQPQDEIILSRHDYPNLILAWKQREARDNIKLKWVEFDVCEDNELLLAEKYIKLFTPKTKLVYLTHIINWTGQILPCKIIAEKAQSLGIEVAIDAAQSVGQIDFKITDFPIDYLATSGHKWMTAPVATSILYIKKNKIPKITPLFPNADVKSPDIRKFEIFGTRSVAPEICMAQSIEFHEAIGMKNKQKRLQFLTHYWTEKAKKIEGFELLSSAIEHKKNAISLFRIKGIKSEDVANQLYTKFKIHTVPCIWENIDGVRVSPHIYTSLKELDKFVEAIKTL